MEIPVDKYIDILNESRKHAIDSLVAQPDRAAVEDTVNAIKVSDDLITLLRELKMRREAMAEFAKVIEKERERKYGAISR